MHPHCYHSTGASGAAGEHEIIECTEGVGVGSAYEVDTTHDDIRSRIVYPEKK